jgi:hypothetical protein
MRYLSRGISSASVDDGCEVASSRSRLGTSLVWNVACCIRSYGLAIETYDASTTEERPLPESLKPLAEQLAAYISNEILDHDELGTLDVLDALASLGLTLVEDQIAESPLTYQESLPDPEDE